MAKKKRSRSERRKAKEKAQKQQMDALKTFEGRKQFVQSKGLTNLVTRFKKGKGIKRNESKKNRRGHSFNPYRPNLTQLRWIVEQIRHLCCYNNHCRRFKSS